MTDRWGAGERIVHQEVWAGRVWAARPLTVVEDAGDRLLLWMPHGTRRKVPAPPADVPLERPRDPRGLPTEASHRGVAENLERGTWTHTDHVWDVSTLWILRPDDWHATWVTWLPSGDHLGWYVNLQAPYRRTALGIEAMDLMLDIVVEPDRTWRWKDRAELDEIVARGIFDASAATRVQTEAEAVIARIEAGDPPFDDEWLDWQPDPAWAPPVLPAAWADLAT